MFMRRRQTKGRGRVGQTSGRVVGRRRVGHRAAGASVGFGLGFGFGFGLGLGFTEPEGGPPWL